MPDTEHRTAAQIADRISWRDPEALVSAAVIVMFAAGYGFTYFVSPPDGSEQAVGQMQGALLGALGSVVTYWIGSSRSSRRSADRADKALDLAKTATEVNQTLDVTADTVNVAKGSK